MIGEGVECVPEASHMWPVNELDRVVNLGEGNKDSNFILEGDAGFSHHSPWVLLGLNINLFDNECEMIFLFFGRHVAITEVVSSSNLLIK